MKDLWTIAQPGARLLAALEEGVLLRGAWQRTADDGRELACALGWMSREVRDAESVDACPATLMPVWAAEVVPWMDDAPSETAWPSIMRRLGTLIDRTTPEIWTRRLQATWCRIAVAEAMQHTGNAAALAACGGVVALLDRAIAGDEPSRDEWAAARAKAVKAAARAAQAAARARASAAWATRAAAAAVEAAANAAVETAAAVAKMAAGAAAAVMAKIAAGAAANANAAVWAAERAAADRMAHAMLDALEREIEQEANRD